MKNYLPIKEQVITLELAKELAELLGDDAPGSLWAWVKTHDEDKEWFLAVDSNAWQHKIAANTGDELGVLLPKILICDYQWERFQHFLNNQTLFFGYQELSPRNGKSRRILFKGNPYKYEAQAKASLAIQGLKKGFIKKKEFKYESP